VTGTRSNHPVVVLTIAFFLLSATAGCPRLAIRKLPGPVDPQYPLPEDEFTDPGRHPSGERFADLEEQYLDVHWNYTGRRHQRIKDWAVKKKLLFPTYDSLPYCWSLLLLARDFEAEDQLGGASLAYWNALAKAGDAFGSRWHQEIVKRAAFSGLADIAEQRGQPKWASVFQLCADLAGVYLDSGHAAAEHERFYGELAKLQQAEAEAVRKMKNQRAAEAFSQVMLSLAQGMAQQSLQHKAASGQLTAADTMLHYQQTEARLKMLSSISDSVDESISQAKKELAGLALSFKTFQATEIPEIQAGKPFAGREALSYIVKAEEPSPYLDVVADWASESPAVLDAIAAFDPAVGPLDQPEVMLALAERIQDEEVFIATYERNGRTPEPSDFRTACLEGDPHQCLRIGLYLCDQGDTGVCVELGVVLEKGHRVAEDPQLAAELYARACTAGSTEGCRRRARVLTGRADSDEDDARAAEAHRLACDHGEAESCFTLGNFYLAGEGVEPDDAEAADLFKRGCKGDSLEACLALARLYDAGRGVEVDAERANKLYEHVCRGGIEEACDETR